MYITIDERDKRPLYQQVVDEIKSLIAGGELPEGSSLPPVRQVAADLGVNLNTIAYAYRQLQKQGLVNKLAELKMLRSLQFRVNRRTKQLGRLVDGEQATESDVVGQLKQLSERQSKVQRATYDLSTGKNQ